MERIRIFDSVGGQAGDLLQNGDFLTAKPNFSGDVYFDSKYIGNIANDGNFNGAPGYSFPASPNIGGAMSVGTFDISGIFLSLFIIIGGLYVYLFYLGWEAIKRYNYGKTFMCWMAIPAIYLAIYNIIDQNIAIFTLAFGSIIFSIVYLYKMILWSAKYSAKKNK
jgi:hypothetical protein